MHVFLTQSNPITFLKLLLLFSGNKIISHDSKFVICVYF